VAKLTVSAYRSSHLRIAPANLEQPCAFVNPNEVEFEPNPVLFSHLYAQPRAVTATESIAEADPSNQLSPPEAAKRRAEAKLREQPFELDAADSEFNPWYHGPIPMVRQVPHRWEKTPGVSRMFFDAEPVRVAGRKRCSFEDQSYSPEPSPRKRQLGCVMSRSQKRSTGPMQSAHTQVLPCANFSNVHQDQNIGLFDVLDVLHPIHKPAYSETMKVHPTASTRNSTSTPFLAVFSAIPSSSVQLNQPREWCELLTKPSSSFADPI
jgi:hypothetical protein